MRETMTAGVVPASVFHGSQYLRDELTERGWTLDDLTSRILGDNPLLNPACARRWGIERLSWNLYLVMPFVAGDGRWYMGEEAALALERVLGISAEFWIRTDALWNDAPRERRVVPDDCESWLSGGRDD